MTMTNKFVVDTNVVISAVLVPYSIPAQALRQARRVGIILQSQATLDELDRVLHRKKFDKYVSEIDRLEFLAKFATKAQLVEIRHTTKILFGVVSVAQYSGVMMYANKQK